jgi:LytS/YehU family sensor histidine kinase
MLASEDDEELMVVVADTTMGNSKKCFSSEQVKNLAVLFLNDRIRLQFVESAIVHLSDYANASLLESLFQDEENRKKIKATIEKNQR